MKGLDWPNERFVRLYVRDTAAWALLGWQAQCLWLQLLRKMDRAGVVPLDGSVEPWESVAAIFPGASPEAVEQALAKLIERGWLIHDPDHGVLVDPEFIERDEAPMSGAARQRRSRETRRDRSASRDLTRRHAVGRDVTKRDGTVTAENAASQPVTPSVPSVPSEPSVHPEGENDDDEKGEDDDKGKKLTRPQAEMRRILAVFTAAGVDPPSGKMLGAYGKALKSARETWGEATAVDRVVEILGGIAWQTIEKPAPYGLKVIRNAILGKVQPLLRRRNDGRRSDHSAAQATLDSAGAFQ